MLISLSKLANFSLSSVTIMDSMGVPKTSTLCFASIPFSNSSVPQFNAVCPPNANNIPSGFSFSITFSTKSVVIGKK